MNNPHHLVHVALLEPSMRIRVRVRVRVKVVRLLVPSGFPHMLLLVHLRSKLGSALESGARSRIRAGVERSEQGWEFGSY